MRIRTPAAMLRERRGNKEQEITKIGEHLLGLLRLQDINTHLEAEDILRTNKLAPLAVIRNSELATQPMYSPSIALHEGLFITPHYDPAPPFVRSMASHDMDDKAFLGVMQSFTVGTAPASFVAVSLQNKASLEVAYTPAVTGILNEVGYSLGMHAYNELNRDWKVKIKKAKGHITRAAICLAVVVGLTFTQSLTDHIILNVDLAASAVSIGFSSKRLRGAAADGKALNKIKQRMTANSEHKTSAQDELEQGEE